MTQNKDGRKGKVTEDIFLLVEKIEYRKTGEHHYCSIFFMVNNKTKLFFSQLIYDYKLLNRDGSEISNKYEENLSFYNVQAGKQSFRELRTIGNHNFCSEIKEINVTLIKHAKKN